MKRIVIPLLVFSFFFHLSGVTLDLREPTLSEGVLKTERGGVIKGNDFRLQAQKIAYRRNDQESNVTAEGELILEFGEYIFVGDKLTYDFVSRTGTLYNGRTAIDLWYLGGKEILLCPDGGFIIKNGFATTSESYEKDWQIEVKRAHLREKRFLAASDVKFRFFSLPIFWLPKFHLDLNTLFDSPFRYTVRFGGPQGPRIGMTYELFAIERWKTFLRLDYRLKRGWGAGLDIAYKSQDHKETLRSINYIAEDITRYDHRDRTRHRFYGSYQNSYDRDRSSLRITYDKLSDKEMATDYKDRGLYLDTAKRTLLDFRRKEPNYILNFLLRFRVNDFQTVKQELPSLTINTHPFLFRETGIISESYLKASYLELEYGEKDPNTHDYNSPRYQIHQTLYRPFSLGYLKLLPEISGIAIYYGNNPDKFERWMTIFCASSVIRTDFSKTYGNYRHILTPYLKYKYCPYPSTPPDEHFIFDIEDGWYYLNTFRFGVSNTLFEKKPPATILEKFYLNIYAYAFFETPAICTTVPKIYYDMSYNANDFTTLFSRFAWDIDRLVIDHFIGGLSWTINDNLALKCEYRTRSSYCWRKADYYNFMLDSFLSEERLKKSPLSDKRDTLLFHLFYRLNPEFALQFQSRSGWRRKDEPDYNEFQIDFLGTWRSSWHFKFSYRHREDEDRFSFNFNIGFKKSICPSSED